MKFISKSIFAKILLPVVVACGLVITLIYFRVLSGLDENDRLEILELAIGGTFLITFLLYFLLNKFLVSRINVFREIIKQRSLGLKGQIVDIHGNDEIKTLSFLFNQMMESQDQYEFELLLSQKQLKDKTDFITHGMDTSKVGLWDWDFRNDTIWYSPYFKEMLGYKDDELPNDLSTFDKVIHAEDKMVAERAMLDFSKIEAGKVTLESVPFDLQMLIEDVADMHSYKVEEKKLKWVS